MCVGINSTNTAIVSSISDGTNTYLKAKQQTISPNSDVELWYAANALPVASGASLAVNLNANTGASSGVSIAAAQASGVGVVDQTAGVAGGTGTSLTATTPTLTQANDLAIGCSFQVGAKPYSGAAGFTNVAVGATSSGNGSTWLDYQKLSASSAVSYMPTWASGSARIGAAIAAFR